MLWNSGREGRHSVSKPQLHWQKHSVHLKNWQPRQSIQPIFFEDQMGDCTLGKNSGPKFYCVDEYRRCMWNIHLNLNLIQHATQVHEHLGLSFRNASELYKIIDKSLPRHPHFEWHEVVVGGKVHMWSILPGCDCMHQGTVWQSILHPISDIHSREALYRWDKGQVHVPWHAHWQVVVVNTGERFQYKNVDQSDKV